MNKESANAHNNSDAMVTRRGLHTEGADAHGTYFIKCFGADGALKWEDTAENTVMTEGKNALLNALKTTYTVVAPVLGLMTTATAGAAADTLASHAGWTEVASGVIAARQTAVFTNSTANSLALTTPLSFTAVTGGNVGGCFLAFNGATTVVANTVGTLWSAGAFAGGLKTLSASDVLQVSYATNL